MEPVRFVVDSSDYSREVTLFVSPNADPAKIFLFLDAEFYLERMDLAGDLWEVAQDGCAFAFVAHIDNDHRHRDYACCSEFARFVHDRVFEEIIDRISPDTEKKHVIGGLSLSGLAAAHILSLYPDRFDGAICQSGSFWWNDEWLADHMAGTTGKSFYISVGTGEVQARLSHNPSGMRQEVSQLDACRRFAEKMEEQGNTVRFEIFEGGHEMDPWSREFREAVECFPCRR